MDTIDNPVFVVGSPRSGTTLLRSMLDAHPSICCPTWETGVFDRLGPMLKGDFSTQEGEEANHALIDRAVVIDWLRRSVCDLMGLLTKHTGKPRWGEKTPAHVFQMDVISEIFPRAQFLHIVRNGRDVVRSLQNVAWAPRRIRWSVNRWVESVETGRRFGKMLGSDRYLEVRYEALRDKAAETLQEICAFLGEPFTPQLLEFHRPENNSWGVSQRALQKGPINRYRNLGFVERAFLKLRAGHLMRELGYN